MDAGLAIAEMIASLSIPTVSLVLGGSHSIGVPLAVSAGLLVYCSDWNDDDPSSAYERYDYRSSPDV